MSQYHSIEIREQLNSWKSTVLRDKWAVEVIKREYRLTKYFQNLKERASKASKGISLFGALELNCLEDSAANFSSLLDLQFDN